MHLVQRPLAVNLPVGGKDLLGQGRARPGQAHDEHRSRIAVAPAPPPGQEVGGERRDHPVDELMVLLGIVFQTTRRLGRGLLALADSR